MVFGFVLARKRPFYGVRKLCTAILACLVMSGTPFLWCRKTPHPRWGIPPSVSIVVLAFIVFLLIVAALGIFVVISPLTHQNRPVASRIPGNRRRSHHDGRSYTLGNDPPVLSAPHAWKARSREGPLS